MNPTVVVWVWMLLFGNIVAPPGTWTHPRKDPQNTSRADLPGRIVRAPVERWWIGADSRPIQSVWALGDDTLAMSGTALQRLGPKGEVRWTVADAGVAGPVWLMPFSETEWGALASVGGGDIVQFDLTTGKRIWRWSPPAGTEQGGPVFWRDDATGHFRLAVFPQNSVGGTLYEFAARGKAPVTRWTQQYPGRFFPNFGPYGVVADMDNNGRPDILLAAKPAYVAAIDGDTGKILFDLRYPIPGVENEGRPYGLIQAVDIDNDGFRDAVVVSCQVEEYIGVVRNRGGKAFELVWSRFVENDLPYDTKELRPQVDSVADVDGDGRPELVLGLFNDAGDQKWRTVVIDLLRGWDARKREIPGRYFWGCRDIDGDSVAEILVSDETQRRTGDVTRVAVIDGRSGTERAFLPDAALTIANRPLRRDTAFMASRATPLWIDSGTASGFLVRTPDGERLWSPLTSAEQRLRPWTIAPLARAAHLASSAQRVTNPERLSKRPGGRSSVALSPLVGRYRGRPELVVVRGDGTVAGGRPVFGKPNVLEGEWSVPGSCPSLWLGPDGRRLVAVFDPKADRFHVYDPSPGQRNPVPVLSVDLPFEPYRIPGMLIPVPGESPQYFVGMKTGVHTTASALFDSAGKLVWRDDLDGPYPRPAGVLGRTVNGSEWVVDNHGKIILYGANGSKEVVAHGWHETIPKRGNGAKYVLPISGPFGPGDAFRIVLSPGLEQLEILGRRGERLVMEPYGSIYERQFAASAVARDPSSGWMIGMLTNKGVFHCAGIDDAKDRWKWDSGSKPTYATRVVAGDLDKDGRDDFLTATADGTLVALGASRDKPRELWRYRLGAAVRELALADVDGDGWIEIIAETDDGRIRVLGVR